MMALSFLPSTSSSPSSYTAVLPFLNSPLSVERINEVPAVLTHWTIHNKYFLLNHEYRKNYQDIG